MNRFLKVDMLDASDFSVATEGSIEASYMDIFQEEAEDNLTFEQKKALVEGCDYLHLREDVDFVKVKWGHNGCYEREGKLTGIKDVYIRVDSLWINIDRIKEVEAV